MVAKKGIHEGIIEEKEKEKKKTTTLVDMKKQGIDACVIEGVIEGPIQPVKNTTMQSRIKELESQIETINKKVKKLESKVKKLES